ILGHFSMPFSLLNKNKGGADAAGSGGRSPRRGSLWRAEGSDRVLNSVQKLPELGGKQRVN
ncbi:MAG: hypothetical protein ACYCY0_14290, partial [Acidithiobacillus ferrivorans]